MSESADQKRTRRRWLTLAELVAVAGVLIAALTLWNSVSERRAAEAEKAGDRQATVAARGRFELHGTATKGGDAIVLREDAAHELQDVRVTFPSALGLPAQDATDHRIDRDWFAGPLMKLTDGGPDDRVGLMPVMVAYGWTDGDGDAHRATALYDIVWRTRGRTFPFGRALDLIDFRFHQAQGTQARLDSVWRSKAPAMPG